ncbi:hypothetical protein G5B39_15185 (plasmid) [Rhodobacteraceae bacterium SC52]|nr:hypothetical protein G5B39_15185 [Rhodobacteraceae bacterium SC52]
MKRITQPVPEGKAFHSAAETEAGVVTVNTICEDLQDWPGISAFKHLAVLAA